LQQKRRGNDSPKQGGYIHGLESGLENGLENGLDLRGGGSTLGSRFRVEIERVCVSDIEIWPGEVPTRASKKVTLSPSPLNLVWNCLE